MDTPLPGDSARPSNLPEFAVSEIAGAIKRTLETTFGRVRVRGEITECKRYPSGHIYLSLKDENAKLESVIWKTAVRNIGVMPENGVEVIATGKIGTYADRSKYQLIIDRLDYAGEGALLARIEKLRQKLLAEGLFAPERKRPLPRLPQVIGIVTSERGAVIQDIRTTIARRFPRHLILWPVAVQGQGAAEQIAAAIRGFGALPEGGRIPRPDLIIVARGGGSLEDLMAFNEEVVIRAAAESPIPLISAVGHETDTTLIDFASDRRAPTPTAAAELAVPSRVEMLDAVRQMALRLNQAQRAELGKARLRLTRAAGKLPDLPGLVGGMRQRLDDWSERFAQAPRTYLDLKRRPLDLASARLKHPRDVIAAHRTAVRSAARSLTSEYRKRIEQARTQLARRGALTPAPVLSLLRHDRTRLASLAARLEAVSYQAVLARGFALVTRDEDGALLPRAAEIGPGARLRLVLADGAVAATADGTAPKPRRRSGDGPPAQAALL